MKTNNSWARASQLARETKQRMEREYDECAEREAILMKDLGLLDQVLFEGDDQLSLLNEPQKEKFQIYYFDRLMRSHGRKFEDVIEMRHTLKDGTHVHIAWKGSIPLIRKAFAYWNSIKNDLDKHGEFFGWVKKNFEGPYQPQSFM